METSAAPLRQQITERLDQLTPAQQHYVLQLLEELLAPKPNRWEALSNLITSEDAADMERAIAEGPGKINPLDWPEFYGK